MIETKIPDTEKISRWNNQLTEKIVSCAHVSLSRCLADLFVKCRDPEFRRHPSASDLYTRYDALDALYTYKESVARAFKDEFIKGVWNPSAHDQHGEYLDDDLNLPQIIETEHLELNEAVLPISQRVEDAHKTALLHLDLRLDYLNKYLSDPIDPQGIHPRALLDAFMLSISALSLRLPGKVLLCKIFEQQISAALEQLYLDLNKMLIDAGIVDNDGWIDEALRARDKVRTETEQHAAQLVRAHNHAGADGRNVANDVLEGTGQVSAVHSKNEFPLLGEAAENRHTGSFVPTLTEDEFLHLLVEPNTPGSGSSLSKYQRSHLTAALSALQRETLKTGVVFTVEELESAVTPILYNSGIFNANELVAAEHHVITFVDQIFKTLLDGDAGSSSVNPLIARLLIPTIKLALLDFEFFKNPQHPAREFFNHLATLTIGVIDDSDPLTAKLQTIINKILSRFDTNVGVFAEPLHEIRQLAKSEAKRIRRTEEKAQREAQIKARRSIARGTVTATIQRLIQNKKLSRELKDFIQGCWAPYMALIFSTKGPRSRDWKDSILIVRNMVEASQADRTLEDFDRLIGPTEVYCKHLKGKLSELTLDQKNPLLIKRVCVWLEQYHERLVSTALPAEKQLLPIVSVDDLSDDNATVQQSEDQPRAEETTAATNGTEENIEDALPCEPESLLDQTKNKPELPAPNQVPTEPVYFDDDHGIEPVYYDDDHGTEPVYYDDDHGTEPVHYDDDHGTEPVYYDDDHGTEPIHHDGEHDAEPVYYDDTHGIEESATGNSESQIGSVDVSAEESRAATSETARETVADKRQGHDLQENRDHQEDYSSEATTHAEPIDSAHRSESNIDELMSEIGENVVYETDLDKLLKSLPSHVRAGTWYEIYQSDDRAKRRLKLSAILEDTGQVLFANRLGESQLIIDLQTFLEDLREGYSKPINDNNLFDRALTTVISNIRESQEQRASR